MNLDSIYLVCFGVGLALSLLSVLGGFAHLHLGGLRLGHTHLGHTHLGHAGLGLRGHGLAAVNGFTIPAFLCWFGGAGYLLHRYTGLASALTLLLALFSGLAGASLLWAALFKVLLPRERVLTEEETGMTGVLAQVSGGIRGDGGTGEILFIQTGARRAAAARSEDGLAIPRGTEVVVLRYERGIAWVRALDDSSTSLDGRAADHRL